MQSLWNRKLSFIAYTLATATLYCGYHFATDFHDIISRSQAKSLRNNQAAQDISNYQAIRDLILEFNPLFAQVANDLTAVTQSIKSTTRSNYQFNIQLTHTALTNVLNAQGKLQELTASLHAASFHLPIFVQHQQGLDSDYAEIYNELTQYRQFYVDLIHGDLKDVDSALLRMVDISGNINRLAHSLLQRAKDFFGNVEYQLASQEIENTNNTRALVFCIAEAIFTVILLCLSLFTFYLAHKLQVPVRPPDSSIIIADRMPK